METEAKQYRTWTRTQLCEALKQPAKTLILYHRHPDSDCIGSAVALSAFLTAMGSETRITGEDPVPHFLAFLAEGQPFCTVQEAQEFAPERVVAVDVPSPEQLGSSLDGLFAIDLMLDHHERGTRIADGLVVPYAAATAEILFDMAKIWQKAGDLEGWPEGSLAGLYAGMAGDTGGFRYSNTSPSTLRRAAELLETGLDAADICR